MAVDWLSGVGDWLTQSDESIDSFIGSIIPAYKTWADEQAAQKPAPDSGLLGAFQGVSNMGSQALQGVDTAARSIPGGSFLLDLAPRTWDTAAYVGRMADIKGRNTDSALAAWGEMFNTDTWEKAWGTWGQPDHLSFGNLVATTYFNDGNDAIRYGNPFDAQEAQTLQAASHEHWYGELMGGATDLAAGFTMPVPGSETLKASRLGKVADLTRAGEMASTFKAAEEAGTVGALKATPLKDTLAIRSGGKASVESQLAQVVANVNRTDAIPDQVGMLNHLAPFMENATEAAKSTMANIFVEANKLSDPTLRTHVKVNAMLGMMGSPLAKAELRDSAPLVLRTMENASTTPALFSIAEDLDSARKVGGATEYSTNAILDKYFEKTGAKAEADALRKELDSKLAIVKAKRDAQSRIQQAQSEATAAGQGALFDVPSVGPTAADMAAVRTARDNLAAHRQGMADTAQAATGIASRVADFWNVGEDGYTLTGRIVPSKLDRVKTAYRNTVGEEFLYPTNDALPNVFLQAIPKGRQVLSAIGTPRARGGITLADPAQGQLELMESLRRSKMFTPQEIRAAGNKFISTPAEHRGFYVDGLQNAMLQRISARHGRTTEEALRDTNIARRHYDEGRQYATQKVAEADAAGSDIVMLRDPFTGELQAHNKPVLKSHIQDTTPFIDPTMFDHALTKLDDGMKAKGLAAAYYVDEANTAFQSLWKHGVLLRPGLAVRAMLDTELRAVALVGAWTQFANAMNGARNILGGKGYKSRQGLAKIGLARPLDQVGAQALGMSDFMVDVGAGEKAGFRAYSDWADLGAKRLAASKGQSLYGALLGNTQRHFNRLQVERTKWSMYDAADPKWANAYSEQAGVMLNSPTVRQMLAHQAEDGLREMTVKEYVSELFSNPDIVAEYDRLARPQNISKADFVQEVLGEVATMFPSKAVTDDVLAGKLAGGGSRVQDWVESNFPAETRFNVPGPNSILREQNWRTLISNTMNKAYQALLDAPDWWMARHPVYVSKYQATVRDEVASMRESLAPGKSISAADIATIDRRAKAAAITSVRNNFFDTARYTGAHHYVSKIAPFMAPWEDAMMSWSRLMYDDPHRFAGVAGAWNAPAALSQWMPKPIFVDNDGKPLARGEESDNGKYIVLPLSGRIPGLQDLRISQDALNSIAQGQVAWLPGFGPASTASVTFLMGNVIPHEMALDIMGTDNWFAQNALKSMFFNGELPQSGPEDIASSMLPAAWRNLYKDVTGDNYAANVSWQLNKAYMDAQAAGVPFDKKKAMEEAQGAARSAAIVRLISQGVMGLSGKATVEGQFYVDQMHQIRALSADQLKAEGFDTPEEMFAARFPDAAKLDWQLSRNETGINATVTAEKAASRNKGLIGDYPEMGWFILGSDNVGGEFSQTAYNMQRGETYGVSQKGRVRESPEQAAQGALVSQGWDRYSKFRLQLDQAVTEYGLTDAERSSVNQAFVKWLGAKNRDWMVEYNSREDKLAQFWSDADQIANAPGMANRSDIVAYKDYRDARQEVLDAVGMKSLSGTSAKAAMARYYLRQVGEGMAEKDNGFRQMWDRILSGEVEAKPGDEAALEAVAA